MIQTCGIFLYDSISTKFLICHATRSRNQWSIPKGLPELGEKPYEAAKRELYEESNINLDKHEIEKVYELPVSAYKKQRKELLSFLVIARIDASNIELTCHSLVNNSYPEIDRYQWVDLKGLQLVHESQRELIPKIKDLLAGYHNRHE